MIMYYINTGFNEYLTVSKDDYTTLIFASHGDEYVGEIWELSDDSEIDYATGIYTFAFIRVAEDISGEEVVLDEPQEIKAEVDFLDGKVLYKIRA